MMTCESRAAGPRGQCQTSDQIIAQPICFPGWLRATEKMLWRSLAASDLKSNNVRPSCISPMSEKMSFCSIACQV